MDGDVHLPRWVLSVLLAPFSRPEGVKPRLPRLMEVWVRLRKLSRGCRGDPLAPRAINRGELLGFNRLIRGSLPGLRQRLRSIRYGLCGGKREGLRFCAKAAVPHSRL